MAYTDDSYLKWKELTERVARDVYRMEMADGFIPPGEADRRWELLEIKGSHECNERDNIIHFVGSALIALEKMGLISYR